MQYPGLVEQGSSPLTRGTPEEILDAAHRTGLIPAHAGNTGAQ